MALFDRLASEYDEWYQSCLGKLIDKIECNMVFRHIAPLKGKFVLDAGCGTGLYSIRFSQKGAHVTGLDQSKKMLHVASQKSIALVPAIQYVQGDLHWLPFKDHIFDVVTCITALEFCEDPLKVIREFGRVLKPGGQMVIGVLQRESLWMQWVLSHTEASSVYHQANLFTSNELKQLVQKSRLFRSISMETGIHITPESSRSFPFSVPIAETRGKWLNPMYGAFLLLSSRKKV